VHTYAKRYGVVRYTAYDELTVLGVMPPVNATHRKDHGRHQSADRGKESCL
jgi:hypothetical protein